MRGAPPPADRLVRFADVAHFEFPKTRWAFANFRQLMPTTSVWRGAGPPSDLQRATLQGIDDIDFTTLDGRPMRWGESLLANHTDAIAVLHRGRLVHERYFGVMAPHRTHACFSVTKSVCGTLAELLVHEGALDPERMVPHHVPELADTAFGNATVRDVMDMRVGVHYSEDYADPAAGIWDHARAGGTLPRPPGYAGPQSFYAFLHGLRQDGPHGQDFRYKTVNTDVLGWVIRRITGRSFGELMSERLWQPLACEQDADLLVDSEGTEFAGGGLNATLRDLLRLGEAMRCDGAFNGRQVLPAAVVEGIRQAGARADLVQAFRAGGPPTLPGGAYRSMWWMTNNAHGAFSARGIHGQAIYVDPEAEMVVARLASHPLAANVHLDPTSLPAYHALALWLMRQH